MNHFHLVSESNSYPYVTPTLWQSVILRNVGLVKNSLIAKVLCCSYKTLNQEINRLGLTHVSYSPLYQKKSFISIIRNNWNILPNSQILILLNMKEEQFNFELKENDFLAVKLGEKPICKEVYYSPLNKKEIAQTERIKKIIQKNYLPHYAKPFSFSYLKLPNKIKPNQDLKIVYPYSALYGDSLLSTNQLVDEKELKALKQCGINGIWLPGLLSLLAEYPFAKNANQDYLIRIKHLNQFIARAKSYGIRVYLYLNEPRSIDIHLLKEEYLPLIGRKENDQVALCLSQQPVQNYLYKASKYLFENVKDLGGVITITSSENLTHCQHTLGSNCPKCHDYKPYQLAVKINNIMQKAIDAAHSSATLFANLWGWAPYCGYSKEDIQNGIKALHPKIVILSVSEFGTHLDDKQKPYPIGEYSISHGEPCLETIENLNYAKSLNRKIMAKIQANVSWEMSTIPYLPVYECVKDHLNKLNDLGVKDLMASWTLGGYPSVTLKLLSSYSNHFDYEAFMKSIYLKDAEQVIKAVHLFSEGFSHFPFDINTLYFSSLHLGPLNPLFLSKSGYKASMVTFPYDDISSWLDLNKKDQVIAQFKQLISIWSKGLNELKNIQNNPLNNELKSVAEVFYINACSFVDQFLFYDKKLNLDVLTNHELKRIKRLYLLASQNASIGYEASNQYVYTPNLFLEKIIALNLIKAK